MSNAHKGSRLLLKDQLVAVDFSTAHFSYNLDANGIQYGSMIQPNSGYVYTLRPYDGRFGGGIAIEESTSNLLDTQGGNASQDWTKWSHYNNTTYWQSSSQYSDQNYGMVFSGVAHSSNSTFIFDYYPYSFTSGNQYSLGILMKLDKTLTINPSFYINNSSGGQHNVGSQYKTYTLTQGNWTYMNFTVTSSENVVAGNGGMGIAFGTAITGSSVQFAYPMFENKSFSTSFVSGSRSTGKLEYNISLPTDFTISFYYNSSAPSGYTSDRTVVALTNGTNCFNFFNGWTSDWYMGDETNRTRFRLTNATVQQYSFEHLTIVRSGTIYKLYRSGILTDIKDFGTNPMFKNLSVCGGYGVESQYPNGMVSDLAIYSRALSDEEVMQIYISNKPLYNPYDYRAYAF